MSDAQWVLPVLTFLLGSGGVASVLGMMQNRAQNRAVNAATGTGQVIDGLTRLTQEQRAELDRKDNYITELEAKLAKRIRP